MIVNNIKDKRVQGWTFTDDINAHKYVDILKAGLKYFDIPITDPCCEADADTANLTNRDLSTLANVTLSGTSAPALTSVANVASSSASTGIYMRIGNIVQFSGQFTVTPTADATLTTIRVTTPIETAFAATTDASGTATAKGTAFGSAQVIGIVGTSKMLISFTSSGTGAHTVTYSAMYKIIV